MRSILMTLACALLAASLAIATATFGVVASQGLPAPGATIALTQGQFAWTLLRAFLEYEKAPDIVVFSGLVIESWAICKHSAKEEGARTFRMVAGLFLLAAMLGFVSIGLDLMADTNRLTV